MITGANIAGTAHPVLFAATLRRSPFGILSVSFISVLFLSNQKFTALNKIIRTIPGLTVAKYQAKTDWPPTKAYRIWLRLGGIKSPNRAALDMRAAEVPRG